MDCLEVPRITTDAGTAAEIWRKLRAIDGDIGPGRKLVVLNPNSSARFPMRRLPLTPSPSRSQLEDPDSLLITGVAARNLTRKLSARARHALDPPAGRR
jgi:hypothetical protein